MILTEKKQTTGREASELKTSLGASDNIKIASFITSNSSRKVNIVLINFRSKFYVNLLTSTAWKIAYFFII